VIQEARSRGENDLAWVFAPLRRAQLFEATDEHTQPSRNQNGSHRRDAQRTERK